MLEVPKGTQVIGQRGQLVLTQVHPDQMGQFTEVWLHEAKENTHIQFGPFSVAFHFQNANMIASKWVSVAGLTGSDVMLLQDKSKTVAFRSAAYGKEDRKTKREAYCQHSVMDNRRGLADNSLR